MRFTAAVENALGEGGKTLPLSEKSVLANIGLRNHPGIKELEKQGFKFYFVNDGEYYSGSLSLLLKRKTFQVHEHVDLFVGVSGNVMLVDYDFYRQNQSILKQAARENGLKIVYVPEEEAELHPANFLPLSPGRVLVERRAIKTIQTLESNGLKVIPTVVDLRGNRLGGGGLRCIFNEA